MFELLMSADMMVPDPDGMTELLVDKLQQTLRLPCNLSTNLGQIAKRCRANAVGQHVRKLLLLP